ncbi:hypothetical protein ACN20G_10520 [Streptomyces sp. BI20]|uniref:hypothetical protein n=1 Tax=Streptomyces sp. BI20 TaxID=3403460 RepID=UPI003C7532A5
MTTGEERAVGVEGERLVHEYLSRVGDLAGQRRVPSRERIRLVAGLRDEIDRQRARYEPETSATVRHVLDRLGTPEEVLDTHLPTTTPRAPDSPGTGDRPGVSTPDRGTAPDGPEAPGEAPERAGVPQQRGPRRLRRTPPPPPPARTAGLPPHLAGLDELGPSERGRGGDGPTGPGARDREPEPEWWRQTEAPQVPGFAGGIEFPTSWTTRPATKPDPDEQADGEAEAEETEKGKARGKGKGAKDDGTKTDEGGAAGPGIGRRLLRFALGRPAKDTAPGDTPARTRPRALPLLAAALLVAAVVTGQALLFGAGWLAIYLARNTLGPTERTTALYALPGTVLAGAGVWIWGRTNNHWGTHIPPDAAGTTFMELLPTTIRVAALTTAAYLTWRARRR